MSDIDRMPDIMERDIPPIAYRIKRRVIVEVTSNVILAHNVWEAVTMFDADTNYDKLLRNAAGEGPTISNLEWSGQNDGALVERIDLEDLSVDRQIPLDEKEIQEITEGLTAI